MTPHVVRVVVNVVIVVIVVLAAVGVGGGGCRVFSDTISCVTDADCPSDLATCDGGACVRDGGGRDEGEGEEGEGEEGEGEEGEGEEGEGEGGEGEGEARQPCTFDDECPATDLCGDSNTCGADCGVAGNAACAANEFCSAQGLFGTALVCEVGCRDNSGCGGATPFCVDGVCSDCRSNADCGGATPICDGGCRAPLGNGNVGAACGVSSECDAGTVCLLHDGGATGLCTEECDEDPTVDFGPTDCTTFGCCPISGLNRCSLGFCAEACDEDLCANGGAGCCPDTGFDHCFLDLCTPTPPP
jgi:hypothetical protein